MTHAVAGGRPSRAVSAQISAKLLKAGTQLFLSHGYEKTSMDAVAAKAGMSKRTLYTRFPGKAELFEAVVVDVLSRTLRSLREEHTFHGTLEDNLVAFAENLLESALVPDVIAVERVVTGEAKQFPELAARLHQRFADYILDLLSELIAHFEPESKRPPAALRRDAEIFLAMVVLPPLRRAVLFQSKPGLTDEDRIAIARAAEIFAKGVGA
ncbi:TetR/AcrR family transcriptional regulator [Hyphomicrobium sp.]|uniref:TetR/AcrR family transcriptional regulator n=1 Tax=Hyphomicrobium sp. TaxID=82 RepID=UPI0025C59D5F|nr:TetR/AcrR family transcriptional regulator [Hyphomicrobium sp.]MCC7251346.1 TetR/AcrR family transcriptional regulator [Hyphomicrobium sp.]